MTLELLRSGKGSGPAMVVTTAYLFLLAIVSSPSPLWALQSMPWSEPELLAEQATSPVVVADSAGQLHLFYLEPVSEESEGSGRAIFYATQKDGQWSAPLDILFVNGTIGSLAGAAVDREGFLHLVWTDADRVYHGSAHASQAGDPHAWEANTVLLGRMPSADMVQDGSGRLHLAVAPDPDSLSYLYSDDGGVQWSPPSEVTRVKDTANFAIGAVKMAASDQGHLHLTWSYNAQEANWNLWSVWYGRSVDGGRSWQVREVASPLFGESDIAVDGEGNVHLVYGRNIGYPDGRWHRWSKDDGVTWSEAQALYPGEEIASGLTGGFDFAVDGDHTLHLVNSFGGVGGDASAWHMVWQVDHWSKPELLMGTEYHAHFPRLAVSEGNVLTFFAVSPRVADMGLYVRKSISTAALLPTEPVPTMDSDETVEEVAEAVAESPPPASTDQLAVPLTQDLTQAPPRSSGFSGVVVGVTASLVLLLASIALVRKTGSGRH